MGKKLIQQRRGKGSNTYKANSHRAKTKAETPREKEKGTVIDIESDPSRTAPVAKVKFESGAEEYILAPEGISVGDEIDLSREAPLEPGNCLPMKEIPEGVPIYNLELTPGDGGRIARSSGTYGFIVAHERDSVQIYLPSKKIKKFNNNCKASIGKVAGSGRTEKQFGKAGNKHHIMKSRGKLYPRVSGVAMNACDHPFGGSANPGKPKTVSRDTPPGQKVGSIAASRTGKKKK